MSGEQILVGFANALSGPESVWSLIDSGYRPIVFKRKGRSSPLKSIHGLQWMDVPAPEQNTRDCIRALVEGTRSHSVSALLPLDDASLWLLQRVQQETGVPLAGAPSRAIDIALDKSLQVEAAIRAGFAAPATRTYAPGERLEPIPSPPVFIKPSLAARLVENRLVRGKGYFCRDVADVERVAAEWDPTEPAMVQAFKQGVGEGVFGFATGSEVLGWSGHHRIRMMNPNGSGSSACSSHPVSPELKTLTERFLASIGWRGLFMIELLRDQEGTPWFVELNGRCWGSMALARHLGYEYPAWTVRQALEPDFVPTLPESPDRPLIARHLGREIVHLLFVLRGSRGRGVFGWPSRWRTICNLLSSEGETCWYNYRKGEVGVFYRDAWRTVMNQVFKDRS